MTSLIDVSPISGRSEKTSRVSDGAAGSVARLAGTLLRSFV
jgi:hypothetical protein